MKKLAYLIAFVLTLFILLSSGVMWYFHYPKTTLCNIITPSMGTRDLPLIYPSSGSVLNTLSLSFTEGRAPKGSICESIEPFTPKEKIIGDILSGAPSYIHGLICNSSVYNYSAFAHLVSGPYTEKRAYTDKTDSIIYRLIKKTDTGRLFITEGDTASTDIRVYIQPEKICISGKIKTSPRKLMSTISTLIGIPYPIWGAEPDWNVVKNYYNQHDITLMQIRYLEVLAYRVSYLSLLEKTPQDYTKMFITPYLYNVEGLNTMSSSITRGNIEKLSGIEHKLIEEYQSHMRRRRIYTSLLFLLLLIPLLVAYPWESVIGLAGGMSIIAISPSMPTVYLLITLGILSAVIYIFCKITKREIAPTLTVMAISLMFPTIITIIWWGVIPLLKEPSPFMVHLMQLTIPSATITSFIAMLSYIIKEIIPSSTTQEIDQGQ